MKIALDRQHYGKPAPHTKDCGAAGNGIKECAWTRELIEKVDGIFDILGHRWIKLPTRTPQTYGQRHTAARRAKVDLYIACHVNAAGNVPAGWRGYVLVMYIDPKMRSFANRLAYETGRALSRKTKVQRLRKGQRGYDCIDGVADRGIVFEPFFVNDKTLARDKATSGRVAKALAIAVRKVYGAA